ncbi:MAG: DUF559 domain-containing protein, partial [Nanoarchaeota archaeon]
INEGEVCQMYRSGLSLKDVGKKMKCDCTVVTKILIRNNIRIRKSSEHLERNAKDRIGKKLTEIHGYEKAILLKKKVSIGVKEWMKKHPEKVKEMVERLMKNPKWFNTRPERIMKNELIRHGWRLNKDFIFQYKKFSFIKNYPFHIIDFVFPNFKLALYVDGDYWHANPKMYKEYPTEDELKRGIKKINLDQTKQRKRDQDIDRALIKKGWKVIRFWEKDIIKDIDWCIKRLEKILVY